MYLIKRILLLTTLCFSETLVAGEWNSNITGEWLAFVEDPVFVEQENSYLSAAFETEYFNEWNGGDDLFTFKPFYRIDQYDENRTHGDIRELSWIHASNDWEVVAGISKVYWGTTEAVHLVDIINQTDFVENLDGEDKLGQPMVKLTFIKDWGVADFFVLPGFRERTFASAEGRPRFALNIDDNNPTYQSSDGNKHVDYAARWSDTFGEWDVGVAYFKGTSREPLYIPDGLGNLTLLYEIIGQASVDIQSTIESWLFKLEAISRSGPSQGNQFNAGATGIEYTFVGVNETQIDVGIIVEYLYDERAISFFQNDIVIGSRIALNDAESSELLVSATFNLDGDGQNFNLEASSRINESMTLSIEARGLLSAEAGSIFSNFEKDNRIRTELTYYF